MNRAVLALLSYIVFFIGAFAALFTVGAFLDRETDTPDPGYFFGGTTVIIFVVSWLLFKVSRQK
jgi:hypothetical protein